MISFRSAVIFNLKFKLHSRGAEPAPVLKRECSSLIVTWMSTWKDSVRLAVENFVQVEPGFIQVPRNKGSQKPDST